MCTFALLLHSFNTICVRNQVANLIAPSLEPQHYRAPGPSRKFAHPPPIPLPAPHPPPHHGRRLCWAASCTSSGRQHQFVHHGPLPSCASSDSPDLQDNAAHSSSKGQCKTYGSPFTPSITCLYVARMPTAEPSCKSCKPKEAVRLLPTETVRPYTKSCLLATRSLELSGRPERRTWIPSQSLLRPCAWVVQRWCA